MDHAIEQDTNYRFAPVLEPEPEPPIIEEALSPPVQSDIVVVAETPAESEQSKKALRAEMLVKRDALSEKERRAAERRINEKLMLHPDIHRAKTVLVYASDGNEVATDDLTKELIKRGKAVAYPKMTNVAGLMTLWRVRNLDALIPHKHGIRAPDVTRSSPTEPINIDCVIYPGLAFTKGLSRLGRGGGYYDRLSAKLADNCVRIGVCYETQLADQLPQDAHDAKMHWVVTELTVYPYVPEPPVIQALPAAFAAKQAGDAQPALSEAAAATPDATASADGASE